MGEEMRRRAQCNCIYKASGAASLTLAAAAAAAAKSLPVVSDSVRPHSRQPTRLLPHPWDSPGENTGVGCHFLLHDPRQM